jgi:hypothetical protein
MAMAIALPGTGPAPSRRPRRAEPRRPRSRDWWIRLRGTRLRLAAPMAGSTGVSGRQAREGWRA